jgi:hypothetical protein
MHTLKEFTDVFQKLPVLPGDTVPNLLTIEKFRLEIEELEKNNSHWFFPGFALDHSRKAEHRAQEYYVSFVNKGFLWNFDKGLSGTLYKVDADTDPDAIAVYADYIVARLGLVNGLLDKGKMPDVKDFGKASGQAIDLYYSNLPFEASQLFGNIYRDYLRWHSNRAELERSRELLEASLIALVTRHKSLEWWSVNRSPMRRMSGSRNSGERLKWENTTIP